MKFNISYPLTGGQKTFTVDDDKKCSLFYDRRMGQQVDADQLGDEYKGYIFKITGGNDKEGFPMRQGIFIKGRVQILMRKGQKAYRPRRTGEKKRKSIRGCIVGQDIAVLAISVVKKGEKEIEGVTNVQIPRRLGPKRLSRLRRLFSIKKSEGVALIKKNMIRRSWVTKEGKGVKRQKAAKIQRLVTETRLRRKKLLIKLRTSRRVKTTEEAETYRTLLNDLRKKLRKRSSEAQEAKASTKPVQGKTAVVTKGKVATTGKVATGKQAPVATGKQAPTATKQAAVVTKPTAAQVKPQTQPVKQVPTTQKPATQTKPQEQKKVTKK